MKQLKHILLIITAITGPVICIAQTAPTAYDITMDPIVQPATILPFSATAVNSNISAYTVQTVPDSTQGILNLEINGLSIPVGEGMMLTPDLAGYMVFIPSVSFTGNVVFMYSASDENGLESNTARYTIPVIAKPGSVLPIRLLDFTATADNKKSAQLHWQTAQENNSSYFELERSSDGEKFELFATVTAKGNSNINNYQHTDDLFLYNYNTVYYRIKMVDINGDHRYSTVVKITFGSAVTTSIKAWPLPFSNSLNIEYNSETAGAIKINIYSINGAALINTSNVVSKGKNTIALYQAQSLPSGTYLLTISNGTSAQTMKLIKN